MPKTPRFDDAAEAYGREMAKGCGDACEKGGVDEYWWAAVMKVRFVVSRV
jgi:hypothetical protein